MSKIIIHYDDPCEASGVIFHNARITAFDGVNLGETIDLLVEADVLDRDDIITMRGNEIYEKFADLLELEEAYYDKVYEDIDPDYAYEEIEVEGENDPIFDNEDEGEVEYDPIFDGEEEAE